MANTFILISSNTLSSSTGSITFSSIPATYTDLILMISARADSVTTFASSIMTYNGVTSSSVYGDKYLNADGAGTVTGNRDTSDTKIYSGYINAANATANSFGASEIYFSSYGNGAYKVSGHDFSAIWNNASTSLTLRSGLYTQNTAIGSITISPISGANWVANSTFSLYGIKKS
jgi:hypothetical protein